MGKARAFQLVAAALVYLPALGSSGSEGLGVSISEPFFNPSLGESIEITVHASSPGRLTATIVDPHGRVVRRLPAQGGPSTTFLLTWDGRDDASGIVPDEAYSLNLSAETSQGRLDHPGRKQAPKDVQVTHGGFDRQRGVISYRLPRPSRVRVTASGVKPVGGNIPRRTIVDWEPRTAGAIVEQWNGYDESNTVNLLELPDSAITIEARALPANSLITVGNRKVSYREWAASPPRVPRR